MSQFYSGPIKKTERITHLVENLFKKMPEIEAERAVLLTESYKSTEGEPIIMRRAKAFKHICDNIPIYIREEELIVGSTNKNPRGCQTFPEFSYEWLQDEFDTIEKRAADPFYISEETKQKLTEVHKYWKGKTSSELATSYMDERAKAAIEHNIFTPGNYFYNGIGHVTVKYEEVLKIGYKGIMNKAAEELSLLSVADSDYSERHVFLEAVIISCNAAINYAKRYSSLEMMMPVLGIVRVKNIDEAIELAVAAEHGNRHSAHIHSKNIDNLTNFAKAVETTIFVKNAPSYAGIGAGGEGYTTFTIAGPTGEGLTAAHSFCRQRRCVMVDNLHIV